MWMNILKDFQKCLIRIAANFLEFSINIDIKYKKLQVDFVSYRSKTSVT